MSMDMSRGKVPHFRMRPHPAAVGAMIMIMIIGVLLALSFFTRDEGTGTYRQKGILVLIITAILTILLAIIATAKFWHPHLWKKNSTHDRHRQHTKYHPAMRDKEFRNARRQNRR